jgi:Ca2+-binding RTX toxin-like protein
MFLVPHRSHAGATARYGRPWLESFEPRVVPAGVVYQPSLRQLYIEGTVGNDQVHVNQSGPSVLVRFNGRDQSFSLSDIDRVFFRGLAGGDLFVNNTAVPSRGMGDAGNDRLVGGLANDTFDGGAGADVCNGRSGNDALNGGIDADLILGGLGADVILGSLGNDRCDGGDGDDRLRGNYGGDLLTGGNGRDDLWGDLGDDRLFGGLGDDQLRGGRGRDHINGGGGDDRGFDDDGDPAFECEGQEFVALMTGPGGAVARAEFEPDTGGGFPFDLEADRMPRNATFSVRVGGAVIGSFATDSEGEGDLRLNNRTLPISTGTVIQVTDLTGAFVLQGTFILGPSV